MSTKAIIWLFIALVVIGGGAWYFSQGSQGAQLQGEGNEEGAQGSSSFAEFLAMGGSRECTVTVNNPDAPSTGVVFVSGNEVRSDMVSRPSSMDGEISAHMIRTGGYIYMWSDMMPQGVRVAESAATDVSGNTSTQAGMDFEAQVDYDCKMWIPDQSKFEVPSTVTFMEFNAGAMPTLPEGYQMPN